MNMAKMYIPINDQRFFALLHISPIIKITNGPTGITIVGCGFARLQDMARNDNTGLLHKKKAQG